jgi:hypothetical protein
MTAPIRDTLNCLEMLMRVRVYDNRRTFLGQPKISIRVVEVPMRIDEACDWIAAETVGGLHNAGPHAGYSCVDETLVVRTDQDRDIATGALEDTDVAS